MDQQSSNLLVSVRELNGSPLDLGAIVKLDSYAGVLHLVTTTRNAGTASFPSVPPGDYVIEVSAAGYQTATERVEVYGSGGTAYMVYVYLQPDSAPSTNVPGNPTIMSPRLQAEIDKALDKFRRRQYDAAREHLEKAAKMAPGNPDVPYLLGLLEYQLEHCDAARTKFEAAISLYPAHVKAYVALGELQIHTGHPAEAVQSLEKAYQLNGADWRMNALLAGAYSELKQYDKAEPHAARAVELAKGNARIAAQILLGQILSAVGKTPEATRAFQAVLREAPNDPSAALARAAIAALETPVVVPAAASAAGASTAAAPDTAAAPPPRAAEPKPAAAIPPITAAAAPAWAPPDIDSKEYPLARDVACQQDQILHRAQLRTSRQLANFERFAATEHIVHQEVDANGTAGPPRSKDFTYLVFIEHAKDGTFYIEEARDGGQNLSEFPTHIASTGLISLGVAVFREDYQRDLNYQCEGLGKWRGEPAWQLRFEQRKDVPSRLRTWRNNRGTYRIPLKGRVWVSANTYDVLHLETDLREPQQVIELRRDHLIVDYGPVRFEHGKTSLWLPWYAEMFMEVHGKRYHHRHTLTNYELFSVDTTNEVATPSGGLD